MISSIQIQGYRGFERFSMDKLGRLNLLVGTNNSGKTSVLEALYLLSSRGDPTALWQLLWRRGERMMVDRNPRNPQPELDVCHLFRGHELQETSKFTVSARNQTPERSITFAITQISPKDRRDLFGPDNDGPIPSRLVLKIAGTPNPAVSILPLSRTGGLQSGALEATPRRLRTARRMVTDTNLAQFITAESIDVDELVSLWDRVTLTKDEPLILKALQFLDRDIERIGAQVSQTFYGSRGAFILRRKGHENPIPIGSMGDGMWRLLAMAIAITQCKGGVLLVDEIDTGLHHTVMSDMWTLIFNAAKEFDVQIFATTHSYDCVFSLAKICSEEDSAKNEVTIQRIEHGKQKSIAYSENEIRIVADRKLEVR
jgi:hypothetical protein